MKRHIFIILFLVCYLFTSAQDFITKITLKTGLEMYGTLVDFNPSKEAKLKIGGKEITIQSNEILKIENTNKEVSIPPQIDTSTSINKNIEQPEKNVIITDNKEYPDSFILDIGGYSSIKMRLVRGGTYAMGYNGRHSLRMDSEPVHIVNVTSYYMSEEPIDIGIYKYLKKDETLLIEGKPNYSIINQEDVPSLLNKIKEKLGNKVRFPSEAEWEYAAFSKESKLFFSKYDGREYCMDYLEKYRNTDGETDPVQNNRKELRVVRAYYFSKEKNNLDKLDRSRYKIVDIPAACRLVFKAKDLEELKLMNNNSKNQLPGAAKEREK